MEQNSFNKVVENLTQLVSIPSISREEKEAADWFAGWMLSDAIVYERLAHNLISRNLHFSEEKKTIVLNSHLDTVKPNGGYTRNPFEGRVEEGRVYGLGTNDAGGALLCLYEVFKQFYHQTDLKFNLMFIASAEEEISGKNGIESLLDLLPEIELAIVGEPTEMNLAIAEKGLLVLDCKVSGKGGHAAYGQSENAIIKAIYAIHELRNYSFPKESETLGEVIMNVTMIEAGTQHNVIPAECQFTIDIRYTEMYSAEEILTELKTLLPGCEIAPRSFRLKPSAIPLSHPIIVAAQKMGISTYGSPTLSDQALMPFPSVKIGPGKSQRSHTADEFIELKELERGLDIYSQLLNVLLK